MKKIITKIALGLILVGVFGGVLTVLPNEMAFKFYNQQGISNFQKKDWEKSRENFQKAVLKFNPWKLVGENNQLATLYEQKKYSELNKKLEPILKNKCSLSAEKIPSFCENIFYLAGLTQYRLGEKLETKKQKPFFEQAIFEFQKTLALNQQNTWAKENIDFILKKFAEKQQQEQQKQDQQSGGDSQDKNQDQSSQQGNQQDQQNSDENKNSENSDSQNSDKNSQNDQKNQQNSAKNESGESGEKNKDQQKSSQKDADSEDKKQSSADQNKDGQNGQDEKTAENSAGGNQENSTKKEPAASRLPQNIQQALEQAQQDLEQDKNQKGFNRSRSAAENDKNSRDPFQDDFLQDFFGNDPFFNSFFGGRHEKKFHKNITNPNEKDW